MTFLSWGGHSLDGLILSDGRKRQLEAKVLRALHTLHQEAVVHEDVRSANMLLNPETQEVMLIDFERALLPDPPRRPLGQLVPNKRAWNQETADKQKGAHDIGIYRLGRRLANDRAMVRIAFRELRL